MKRFSHNWGLLIAWWGLLTAALALVLYNRLWFAAALLILFWLPALHKLLKLYRRQARKVSFMFDAIDNADQAFRFAESGGSLTDRQVNASLNRIIKILFQAKADAMQQEKYYELILDSVNTGILAIDDQGRIYQSNREARRLLGLPVLTHLRQLKRIDEHLAELFATAQPPGKYHATYANERGNLNLSISISEMSLRERHVRILSLNDIGSEMDETEIEAWVRLTRVLTHEIMNGITPITSLSETLLSLPTADRKGLREGLETIRSTGKGLIDFVNSYRRFTSLPTPSPSLFYLQPFAERMSRLALEGGKFPFVQVEVDVQPIDLIVYADESLISQVMLNLLKNALQAIGQETEGHISIHAYCTEEEAVVVEVSDSGPLIPEELASQIFIPFFTTKEGGSGIGLPVSRQIMRLSGGSLTLKPAAPETTFVLTFP